MAIILLTGASSFTGYWIAVALARQGHKVLAPLRRRQLAYGGLRQERVEALRKVADIIFDAPFGSKRFLQLAETEQVTLLAHHAADIPDYRAADYDVAAGVARNTDGVRDVFRALARSGTKAVIVTGTTFEAGEGESNPSSLAVSPYGLSKTLTNQALRHFAQWEGIGFAKFVIAAPFGAFEEGRFAWSLFQQWFDDKPGIVRTPRYVRDNIPVPLLADAYVALVGELLAAPNREVVSRPSGIVGTQAEFAETLALRARSLLGLRCTIRLLDQPTLAEPEHRTNDQPWMKRCWDEAGFWDDYLGYYRRIAAQGLLSAPP
ncbi:MAG: NAD(P)-dependent oxidoreductase [Phenylobacterium sp.]|uniref:NAD-dependent epimerase/dehydratase family protein n=1 Tax=Phenylobacterium sp. TaxID=1871053 RepID=UPI002734DC02|nr:NAD(P)-dependent oxidoreductase [Phenylobacterium sp.]MDP3749220.1 NAD(P)-dependent oxidoreductase [Phenylobacterium sp.]